MFRGQYTKLLLPAAKAGSTPGSLHADQRSARSVSSASKTSASMAASDVPLNAASPLQRMIATPEKLT
ncbi:MAG TPA: hypothetical protein DGC76_02735 [Candidatus Accumulibacter sp.]|nr:hypothetical protein [Accumulibacter sp.]